MILLAGNSNPAFSTAVAKYLDLPLAACEVKKFADKEIFVEIYDNVRGEDVFIIQSLRFPPMTISWSY